MKEVSEFDVRVEWQEAERVRAPELSATWCRLEMSVSGSFVTLVDDSSTHSSRRGIYVSLYPLAEWICYNWWFLKADRRPSNYLSWRWTYDALTRRHNANAGWLRNHNFRAAGEGFPWPDLTIVPQGTVSQLVWSASDPRSRPAHLHYLGSGNEVVQSDELEHVLSSLVTMTVERLEAVGIHDTPLQDEWRSLEALDADQLEFCDAAARLGVDPFSTTGRLDEQLVTISANLGSELFGDFLDAADPANLDGQLSWLVAALAELKTVRQPQRRLPGIRDHIDARASRRETPWAYGRRLASELRAYEQIASDARYPIADLVQLKGVAPLGDAQLQAVGDSTDAIRMVSAESTSAQTKRFRKARALWHGVSGEGGGPFVLTKAHTAGQQAGRAFAAELLAPADGIGKLLDGRGPLTDAEDIVAIAAHFGVASVLVEHQIENNVAA